MDDLYEFACPDCGERTVVDAGIRQALLRAGCLVCGSPVSDRDFGSSRETRHSDAEPEREVMEDGQ